MRIFLLISKTFVFYLLVFVAACGASQKAEERAVEVDPAVAADAWLAKALEQAKAKNSAVVAVVHADWCGPCNEMQLRVHDTPVGRELVAGQILLPVDFEDAVGGVLASRLRVLGLPTTLVLRPDGNTLKEYARIEGFDSAEEYRAQLLTALERKTPAVQGCSNADDRPLDAGREVAMLLPDLECSAQQLLSDSGVVAATRLRSFLRTISGTPRPRRGRPPSANACSMSADRLDAMSRGSRANRINARKYLLLWRNGRR